MRAELDGRRLEEPFVGNDCNGVTLDQEALCQRLAADEMGELKCLGRKEWTRHQREHDRARSMHHCAVPHRRWKR